MRQKIRFSALAFAFLLSPVGCNTSQHIETTTAPEATWHDHVAAISEGADSPARAKPIVARLTALGLQVEWHDFRSEEGFAGRNILAHVGGPEDAPLLLIGAHYDRVEAGRGVTDNASGSAAVMELAETFVHRPLSNHRVAVAFWDKEEIGIVGSQQWVAAASEMPALYINFDIFAWGDTLWMMSKDGTAPFADVVTQTASAVRVNHITSENYPPTDHLAFLEANHPAVSFSLMDSHEVDAVREIFFAGNQLDEMPKVMRVIHTPEDTLDKVVSAEVEKALPVIETAIRTWDMR